MNIGNYCRVLLPLVFLGSVMSCEMPIGARGRRLSLVRSFLSKAVADNAGSNSDEMTRAVVEGIESGTYEFRIMLNSLEKIDSCIRSLNKMEELNLERILSERKEAHFSEDKAPFITFENENYRDFVDGKGNLISIDKKREKVEVMVEGFEIRRRSAQIYCAQEAYLTNDGDYVFSDGDLFYVADCSGKLISEGGYQLKKENGKILTGIGDSWEEAREIDFESIREIVRKHESDFLLSKFWKVFDSLRQTYDSRTVFLARDVVEGRYSLREDGVYAHTYDSLSGAIEKILEECDIVGESKDSVRARLGEMS